MQLDREQLRERFRKKGGEEAFLARYVTRHVSYPLTRWLVGTSVTPNQITIFGALIWMLGMAGQVEQTLRWIPIAGLVLAWIGFVADAVDGEVARYKQMFSVKGVYLDMVSHRVIHSILFASVAIGLYRRDGTVTYLFLAMAAIYGELCFTFMLYAKWRVLLDYPKLMFGELQRILDTPKSDQKRLKAGFSRTSSRNPLVAFYDIWFGQDYIAGILITATVLTAIDRIEWLLWIYGIYCPLRATVMLVTRFVAPFTPDVSDRHTVAPPGDS